MSTLSTPKNPPQLGWPRIKHLTPTGCDEHGREILQIADLTYGGSQYWELSFSPSQLVEGVTRVPTPKVTGLVDTLIRVVMGSLEFSIPTNEIRIEPRCRICRDAEVRTRVNELLKWVGVPIPIRRGRTHRVTYTNILRNLEPMNEGRDAKDRITYASLWVHAQRHVDVVWTSGDFRAWVVDQFGKSIGEDGVSDT